MDSYIDIIIFAVVAGVIIWKLRSVLGQRTGNEREPSDRISRHTREVEEKNSETSENVVLFPGTPQPKNSEAENIQVPVSEDVARVQAVDPSFDGEEFLDGARMAFEMILTAFGDGDTKALRPLLTPDTFKTFSGAIEARQKAGQTLESQLIAIHSATLEKTEIEGTDIFVTVRFVTEQVNCLRGQDGQPVDGGEENQVLNLIDLWTFTRPVRARDPNWFLSQTNSVE